MALLDQQGRVLGKINLIDLVVLVIVGLLVVASLGFLVAGGTPTPTYVQVDFNDVPSSMTDRLDAGGQADHGKASITDALIVERSGQSARVFVKAWVMAEDTGSGLRYRQQMLSPGEKFQLTVDGTTLQGSVALTDGRSELTYLAGPEAMVLAVPQTLGSIASGLAVGQVGQTSGNDLFRITSLEVFAGSGESAGAYLVGERLRLAPAPPGSTVLSPGGKADVSFPSGSMSVVAHRPVANGTGDLPTLWTPVLLAVRSDVGPLVQPPMGPLVAPDGRSTANVTRWLPVQGGTVNEPPALFLAAGEVAGTAQVAWLEVELLAVETADGPGYRGVPLRVEETIVIPAGGGAIRGQVVNVGHMASDLQPRSLTLLAANVPPWVADALSSGATEPGPSNSSASLTSISRAPAQQLVVTSDGRLVQATHPVNLDLTLEVDVQATLGDIPTFRGIPLTPGARFVIVPSGIPLEVQVLSVGSP